MFHDQTAWMTEGHFKDEIAREKAVPSSSIGDTVPDTRCKVASVPFWWHSIQLGDVVTPGVKSPELLAREWVHMKLPNLLGKTVLDIGAWDGFFSFAAENAGASRVVALDHYVWSLDTAWMMRYWEQCKTEDCVPEQYDRIPGMWRPEELPGKRGFDVACDVLNSRVESVVADFMDTDMSSLGQFDVVFFLGVLYHLHNPFEALKRLARVTKELAVIETASIIVQGYECEKLCMFFEANELNADVNNWWSPSHEALIGMCRAAGFHKVESVDPDPEHISTSRLHHLKQFVMGGPEPRRVQHTRSVVHAWK